jgi:hypothetical protein
MRRLVASRGMPAPEAPEGKDGEPGAHCGRRDRAGDEDPPGMMELVPRGLADRRDQLSERPGRGQSRGEPRLEARAGGERAERGAHDGRSVDQRRQLGSHDGVASAQESIDGLI